MFPLIRLLFILLIVLTVVYVLVSLYSRAVRRSKLRQHWKQKGLSVDRDTFVRRGLKKYDGSIRRKLILLVYIIPLGAIALLVYVMNFM
ncbi:hypothetical protein [Parasedimentitalea psychrophila]|uniref:Uncharacterized protein n=1 Tax=Parasedimentitalea psychrophila TaxID=2997337 RepID=A0A9Y2L1Q7_9RHOB|nr:hypothetical protein [Parasedimentitalea psychrophila]NRB16262.1 hypothetical protein [Paracoccaceae bacterium]WIY26543.1 hypothetical protein QPJ95_06390 [Parasedimentitalea psychrophila]